MSNRIAFVPPSLADRKRSAIATLACSALAQPAKRSGRSAAYA
jgi:hypothetical protein